MSIIYVYLCREELIGANIYALDTIFAQQNSAFHHLANTTSHPKFWDRNYPKSCPLRYSTAMTRDSSDWHHCNIASTS